jgi:hypothetical protein
MRPVQQPRVLLLLSRGHPARRRLPLAGASCGEKEAAVSAVSNLGTSAPQHAELTAQRDMDVARLVLDVVPIKLLLVRFHRGSGLAAERDSRPMRPAGDAA